MKKIDVIRYFGSGTAAAKALGLSKQAVSAWGSTIPELQAIRLQQITNEKLKYDPVLYGREAVVHDQRGL